MKTLYTTILPRLVLTLVTALGVVTSSQSLQAQAISSNLENPAPGSFQSGIGIVSGWRCTGGIITVRFDDDAPIQAAYGTSRGDTQAVCRDTNNGFGLLWNFNDLGDGRHTVRLFDNGVQFASATFTVQTLGEEFLRGAHGTFKLPNFPRSGAAVIVQWQENQQGFVITGMSKGPEGGTGECVQQCEEQMRDCENAVCVGSVDFANCRATVCLPLYNQCVAKCG